MNSFLDQSKVAEYIFSKLESGFAMQRAHPFLLRKFADFIETDSWDQVWSIFKEMRKQLRSRSRVLGQETIDFVKSLKSDKKFTIRVLDEDPIRTIFGVDILNSSICRVVKQNKSGKWEWAGSCLDCQNYNFDHIDLVKKWDESGRIPHGNDHFKDVLDSLRTKGPKRPTKNIMQKPSPKIPKPLSVSKPQGTPNKLIEDKKGK
jgi:hypothetical protein